MSTTLRTIGKQQFDAFIDKLVQTTDVVGPMRNGPGYSFDVIERASDLCLGYNSTVVPPKKLLFPAKETLLQFTRGKAVRAQPVIEATPRVVIGVHPCDLHALSLLDRIFQDTNADTNYLAKREKLTVIGVDCEPDDHCFCGSVGTMTAEAGYDLFLTDLGGRYLVEVATERGGELLNGAAGLADATEAEVKQRDELRGTKKQQCKLAMNSQVTFLPMIFDHTYNSEVWKEEGERCLSCGSCNLVCPTCYCFDVRDEMQLNLTDGERVREWDGCMLPEFAVVASGENFRERRSARLRHRMYRKFQYLMRKYGESLCVGCGRCIRACLVHISPVDIVNQLLLRP